VNSKSLGADFDIDWEEVGILLNESILSNGNNLLAAKTKQPEKIKIANTATQQNSWYSSSVSSASDTTPQNKADTDALERNNVLLAPQFVNHYQERKQKIELTPEEKILKKAAHRREAYVKSKVKQKVQELSMTPEQKTEATQQNSLSGFTASSSISSAIGIMPQNAYAYKYTPQLLFGNHYPENGLVVNTFLNPGTQSPEYEFNSKAPIQQRSYKKGQ